jgi:uncharacterized membrane protein YfcA
LITTLVLLAIGIFSGVLGAIMGLGGGIFLVPILTLAYRLPMHIIIGTSLVGVIATSAGVAAFAPRGRGADVSVALRLEMATTAGAIAGSVIAGWLNHHVLALLFACVLFFTSGYTFYKAKRKPDGPVAEQLFHREYKPSNWAMGFSGSGFAGMMSGLLGVGGGFIKVPVMYTFMGIPLGVATATSNFMVGITAAASVFIYYGRGDIHPLVAIPTALGVFVGAMLGVYVLPRLRASWVRMALIWMLLVMGLYMVFEGLHS